MGKIEARLQKPVVEKFVPPRSVGRDVAVFKKFPALNTVPNGTPTLEVLKIDGGSVTVRCGDGCVLTRRADAHTPIETLAMLGYR